MNVNHIWHSKLIHPIFIITFPYLFKRIRKPQLFEQLPSLIVKIYLLILFIEEALSLAPFRDAPDTPSRVLRKELPIDSPGLKHLPIPIEPFSPKKLLHLRLPLAIRCKGT